MVKVQREADGVVDQQHRPVGQVGRDLEGGAQVVDLLGAVGHVALRLVGSDLADRGDHGQVEPLAQPPSQVGHGISRVGPTAPR